MAGPSAINVDPRVTAQRPDLVTKAIKPDYALGTHTASLGLAFSTGAFLPERYRNGAFIGQHGSWNRKPRSGYKVIFVPSRMDVLRDYRWMFSPALSVWTRRRSGVLWESPSIAPERSWLPMMSATAYGESDPLLKRRQRDTESG